MATQTLDTTGLPDEAVEFIKSLVEENSLLAKSLDETTAALEAAEGAGDGEDDDGEGEGEADIEKSLAPAAAELFKSMKAEIAKANAAAADAIAKADHERTVRETAEWISKAADFSSLAAEKTELGSVLRECSSVLSKSAFDALLSILTAANEAVAKGDLFKEVGKSSGTNTGATDLDGAARKLMEVNKSMTYPDAIRAAAAADPALVAQYRKGE